VLDAGFFFGLFFYHKDGSIMLLRNVGWYSTDYKGYIQEDIARYVE
jgi:hypothetical protein